MQVQNQNNVQNPSGSNTNESGEDNSRTTAEQKVAEFNVGLAMNGFNSQESRNSATDQNQDSSNSNNSTNTNEENEENEEKPSPFSWDSFDDDEEDEKKNEEKNEQEKGENLDDKSQEKPNSSEKEASWKDLGSFLGIDLQEDSIEALKKGVETLKSGSKSIDPRLLKMQEAIDNGEPFEFVVSQFVNVQNSSLSKLLSLSPEEKIRWKLTEEGLDKDDVEEFIDNYKSNDQLGLEAKRIDAQLKKRIAEEARTASTSQEAAQMQAQETTKRLQNELQEVLSKTTQMFGIPIGKNETEIKNTQKKIFEYMKSDSFLTFNSHEEATQIAFLKLNLDKVMKILKSSGKEAGKNYVLNNMRHVDLGTGKGREVNDHSSSQGFDVNKAMEGLHKK